MPVILFGESLIGVKNRSSQAFRTLLRVAVTILLWVQMKLLLLQAHSQVQSELLVEKLQSEVPSIDMAFILT